ncbi:phosphatidylinositol 4,5-bisphosphate 3-kinase catalytic subunit alpha isoform-like isoform X2 [Lytechinus variegatus]|uniref:phosphatidylinositol 4,5-bisphosphate 3-kinase catalytic subunit alpha isoform-like isoform X2 n=1 Tax=Lytechinus variegatus TaxID=7654 RepID=UPI001BB15C95|nr:phosphatidylinositol 4,5-bisphosphate 3-kinase catalytic subunit alpha isoform-like isoform X2 [Lytechinus variegatus]
MPPSSGELWGSHLMPSKIRVECLLPNGILVTMECVREATLEKVKAMLWREAFKYPLAHLLGEASSYIFVSITQDAEKEEFYDEGRRLCDLRLFQPWLKVVEPAGNREEKMLNYEIGAAIGVPINEFDSIKDPQVVHFRRNILTTCMNVVEEREEHGKMGQALYAYPPNLEASEILPNHILQKLETGGLTIWVWVVSLTGHREKYSIMAAKDSTPELIIARVISKRTEDMDITNHQRKKCIEEYKTTYVLKVCGCEEYLLDDNYPVSQYKYIRECLLKSKIPELMLMSKDTVLNSLPDVHLLVPSYMRRASTMPSNQTTTCVWEVDENLQVKINFATYVNVKELDKIYVRTGIYHGEESLCPIVSTEQVPWSNPRWNEWLTYDIKVNDIPRSARWCVSICSSEKRKGKKEGGFAIAWGNVNLFDFTNRLQMGNMRLYLWPPPKGNDDLLNPFGQTGPNPNKDAPCLELEFHRYPHSLIFPCYSQIQQFAFFVTKAQRREEINEDEIPPTEEELEQLEEILNRDRLHEMSVQEKELVWKLRLVCRDHPYSLPKLLSSVKWYSREDVAQVLKYESYLDNPLARFLLKRSLYNQRIGHFFFWHLRSEMHKPSVSRRFGLMLEAYCRSLGPYLKLLVRQVEALDKLSKLTESLNERKDDTNRDRLKYLTEHMAQPDFFEALQEFPLPLNPSFSLGKLRVDKCKIMSSAKRPLWLEWENPDQMSLSMCEDLKIIFKRGDDLRQDMLTLQMIQIMDSIWQQHGLDLKMTPYRCLATGNMTGLIEVVRNSSNIYDIQHKAGIMSTLQLKSGVIHQWIKEKCKGSQYDAAIDTFTKSCAGYCVATFILGIGDRHSSNIMVSQQGQIFHIDFGHFLGHVKKKYGIKRERVPFVLTEDFLKVITKGNDISKSQEFKKFQELCCQAYLILRDHANLFISLFTLMLGTEIPELQSIDDVGYLHKTLAVGKTENEALEYFLKQLNDAHGGGWTTKMDWLCHALKHGI